MPAIVVVGAAWGDEGKGRIVDELAEDAHTVVRYGGGDNAGHTLVVDGTKYKIHLLPCGIVRKDKTNVLGPYVATNLEVLAAELAIAHKHGSKVLLDPGAPVILRIHREIDRAREIAAGSSAIGTTQKGIAPAYEHFWSRKGPKLGQVANASTIGDCLKAGGYAQLEAVVRSLGQEPTSLDAAVEDCRKYSDLVGGHLADTREHVHRILAEDEIVLFESSQGVGLDIVHGGPPYVTSSFCTPAAVSASFGVYKFARVIGVVKAYMTRVGAGPFPTELNDEIGDRIRKKGEEFGTTTGRPRRCGWPDPRMLRHNCRVAGVRELVVTRMDTLAGFDPVQMCVYYVDGGVIIPQYATLTAELLARVKPNYLPVSGWSPDITGCRSFGDLPPAARIYLHDIADVAGVPVSGIGIGPSRSEFIWFSRPSAKPPGAFAQQ